MAGTERFADAVAVLEHLRTLPEVTLGDPGGNVYTARLCPHCGVALVASEEDGTLFVDDAAALLGGAGGAANKGKGSGSWHGFCTAAVHPPERVAGQPPVRPSRSLFDGHPG